MESQSRNQIKVVETMLERAGFVPNDSNHANFRYSITREPERTFILGAKLPIMIPIDHTPPVELVAFYISITIRAQWLDENFINLLGTLATQLRTVIETLQKEEPYNFEFNLDSHIQKISLLLEKYYPPIRTLDQKTLSEISDNEVSMSIRKKVFEDRRSFKENIHKLSRDIQDVYSDFGFHPTSELPPELSKGFPRSRRNWIVLFKNQSPNEYLIEEPGSITYFRDYIYNNAWIRTGFESVTPNIWYQAFSDQDYQMNYLFYDWIVYARGLLKKVQPIIAPSSGYRSWDVKAFSDVQYLKEYACNLLVPGLFMPRLVYENQKSSEWELRDEFLFSSSPTSLEELATIEDFAQVQVLMRKGQFPQSEKLLLSILETLKTYHHIFGVTHSLIFLADISLKVKNYSNCLKYALEALEYAKSGKIPISDITKLHILLIQTYENTLSPEKSKTHVQIILTFLKSLPVSAENDQLILKCHLEFVRMNIAKEDYHEANLHFKELLKRMDKYPEFQFLYYFERSKYHSKNQKPAKQYQALQKALGIKQDSALAHAQALYDLGEYMSSIKNDNPKALAILTEIDVLLTELTFENLKLKLRTHRLIKDILLLDNRIEDASKHIQEIEKINYRLTH
ncbi:MAG: tetratricopeptide repeat protein [Promethearchaeota archaeon]